MNYQGQVGQDISLDFNYDTTPTENLLGIKSSINNNGKNVSCINDRSNDRNNNHIHNNSFGVANHHHHFFNFVILGGEDQLLERQQSKEAV